MLDPVSHFFCRVVRGVNKNLKNVAGTYRYISLKWDLHDLRPPLLKYKPKKNRPFSRSTQKNPKYNAEIYRYISLIFCGLTLVRGIKKIQ